MTRIERLSATPPTLPERSLSGLSSRSVTIVVSGLLTVVLGALICLLPAPFAIYLPGPVTNVLGSVGDTPLIRIVGAESFRPDGSGTLDMTTVQILGGPGHRVPLPNVVYGWLSRNRTVRPIDQVFPPGQSAGQAEAENAAEMSQSQQSATAAGLREAGRTVPETVRIAGVGEEYPAAKVLRAGDQVLTLQGRPVTSIEGLRSTIQALRSGASVRVSVRRDGITRAVSTTTSSADGRTVLGVDITADYDFPVDVKFATRDVGGPSAGMMFALGIYDLLTPGDLVGNAQVAGTGTIDGKGTVGPIGGIAQKLVGARKAGAQWFLAPAANCDEVVGHVPDGLRVVKTSSLHQSRLDVQQIAAGQGDSLPTCTR